jgi:hypothetical protein
LVPGREQDRPGHGVANVITSARSMINGVTPAPRRPPLKLAELRDETGMIEQLDLATIQ